MRVGQKIGKPREGAVACLGDTFSGEISVNEYPYRYRMDLYHVGEFSTDDGLYAYLDQVEREGREIVQITRLPETTQYPRAFEVLSRALATHEKTA